MRAHYLQHVPFEGIGTIEFWLKDKGYTVTSTQVHLQEGFPDPKAIDILIIMGGPMSANDELQYPWLKDEKRFIQRCLQQGIAILGICLGAQLIASATGAEVVSNKEKEIGWYPIHGCTTEDSKSFCFAHEVNVFHWHGETFNLPKNAIKLAESKGCSNQAFQLGTNVIGLQFHLETTPALCEALIKHCGNEIVEGKYIQSRETLLQTPKQYYLDINDLMVSILKYLTNREIP